MMSIGTIARALVTWFAILVLAVGNGFFREAVLIPYLGTVPGMVLSGVLLSGIILLVAWVFLPWIATRVPAQRIAIGAGWLVLTLVFEFSFGWLEGKPTAVILEAYTFKDGNIWPIVLLVTAVSPWLAGKFRGLA
jgi:hypothetical protein